MIKILFLQIYQKIKPQQQNGRSLIAHLLRTFRHISILCSLLRFPFESFTKNSTEINCLSSIKRRKKTLYYFLACAQYSATPLSVLECAMRCEGGGRARQGRTEQGLWGRSGLSSAFHVSAAVVAIAERIFWRDAFGILTCRLCCASLLRMRSLSK